MTTTNAKFEEGKTYFNIWEEEAGRPHMRHYTIVKRTPKTIVLKSGYRCRIFTGENGGEAAKVSYRTYIYASDLCTVEAENRQVEADKAWDKMDEEANRRMKEIAAAEAEREEIMSTPLTTVEAMEVATDAEIENARMVVIAQVEKKIFKVEWEINYIAGDLNDIMKNHYKGEDPDGSWEEHTTELGAELAENLNKLAELKAELDALKNETSASNNPVEVIAETDGSEDDPDEEFTVNVMPAEIDDADDELVDPPIKESNREKFLRVKKLISYKSGRELKNGEFAKIWLFKNSCGEFERTNKATIVAVLKEFGLTLAEFLAEQKMWVAEGIAQGAAQMAIDDQAAFLKDKIAREVKACDDNSTVFNYLPAIDDLNDVNENNVTQVEIDDTEQNEVYALEAEMDARLAEGKEIWTDEDIAQYYKACQIRVKKIKARLAENISDEERAKLLLEFETGYPEEYENYQAELKIEPQDEFSAELAKLKTAADDAYNTLIKAQEAHEQSKNALKNFLNDTAFNLKQKLDALPLDYTITLKKTSGTTYRVADFSEIYIGAYHIGCDVEFRFENWAGRMIARYDTPAQVETVINMLKAAIERGDKEFTFPTIDELNNPPKMPPCAPKSPNITAEDNLPVNDETTPKNAYDAQIAHINKNAPKDWQISFDADKNNFPVKFKDQTITTLDSLALTKFLTPELFFEQFKPLIDKNYSPKEQFLDDRRKELAALLDMRKSITEDAERLKTIDDMIASLKRDLLEVALE